MDAATVNVVVGIGGAVAASVVTAFACHLYHTKFPKSLHGISPAGGGGATSGKTSFLSNDRKAWTEDINDNHEVQGQGKNARTTRKTFEGEEEKLVAGGGVHRSLLDIGEAPPKPGSKEEQSGALKVGGMRRIPSSAEQIMRRRSIAGDDDKNKLSFRVDDDSPMCKVYEVSLEEIKLLRTLGAGSYGKVYSALWRNELVAIKKLSVRCAAAT